MQLFMGIDPGISGACALLDAEKKTVRFWDTPVLSIKVGKKFKNVPNAYAMAAILREANADGDLMVVIEKVNAMPDTGTGARMGATSAFSFGMGFGLWLGILAALEIPHQQVHPATWKSKIMSGMSKEKDASRVRAMELYPQAAKDLSRKKDHGRGDALLLARYAWLTGAVPDAKQQEPMQNLFDGSGISPNG